MNVFKIAWRSIQHRGLGSVLTIVSMALGVMLVVAVLSIHGVISQSFKNNNSFGYNVIVGARGGGMQLTMNTVYYISQPVENIPYEYYLAFCNQETRDEELKHSIAYQAFEQNQVTREVASGLGGFGLSSAFAAQLADDHFVWQQRSAMGLDNDGMFKRYTHCAVPLCLGDAYVDPATGADFRCVGTKPRFFTDLVLDIDTEKEFEFAQGRNFFEKSDEHGYFECVIGATVARRTGLELGDKIQATHGDPSSESAHIHEQYYTIVGILESTGTPNDRVVFLNMEGFYLMEDHAKPVENDSILKTDDSNNSESEETPELTEVVDPFADGETFEDVMRESPPESFDVDPPEDEVEGTTPDGEASDSASADESAETAEPEFDADLNRIALPVEQREVTAVLISTSRNDSSGILATLLPGVLNEGPLETTLDWTPYRPEQSQKASQAVNPVDQVTRLFAQFVDPIRLVLLALTSMICIVSALSIVVGIYNSMNQRQHEIAVMRALGASRGKVMMIMLCESILLAVAGGMLGWIAGHGLNAALGPTIEDRTGVAVGFFDFAPGMELAYLPGASVLPAWISSMKVSPELMLIPALIVLAILVGLYPAISAYKTDVSRALGK